ncbi:DUF4765 family protein [Sodalis sp. RH16]|uniref:DUF4765 family protein n=1 Tax=Sodalis sp. RH16 TaxID=3394331 RepID=UPI0039B3762A
MLSILNGLSSYSPRTVQLPSGIPSWDTEAYARAMARRYPKDEVLDLQARNPSDLRRQLDLIARGEERIIASLALYDKFFLPAEPVIETWVKEPLMEIYRLSRTFRRLFNHWKVVLEKGGAPERWQLLLQEGITPSFQGLPKAEFVFMRGGSGRQQTCYPVKGLDVSNALQILLSQMVWALLQNFNANEVECWAGAAEYTNLIMRETAWPFPSLMRYMPLLVVSHCISPAASVETPPAVTFSTKLYAKDHFGKRDITNKVLRWSALTGKGALPRGEMARFAKDEGVAYRELSRYIGATGRLTNRGNRLMAQAAAPMDEKLLASNVRAWAGMSEELRWASGGQKGYVKTRGLTLYRWRHYVDKNGNLTKRGHLLLARAAG